MTKTELHREDVSSWIVRLSGTDNSLTDKLVLDLIEDLRRQIPDASIARKATDVKDTGSRSGLDIDTTQFLVALAPFLAQQLVDVTKAWVRRKGKSEPKVNEERISGTLEHAEYDTVDIQISIRRDKHMK
ncbi:hypothetical protein [Arthrobacter dokdonensis]|uniref:hypothetical protein n=1 Tax=Arthrobacter dokdonellae TaxID=2211210 RepID=UPI001013CCA2|nr:hypothetical protein [Arthrobacter dokdonellae]